MNTDAGIASHGIDPSFAGDGLNAFRAAREAAARGGEIAPDALALCAGMDVARVPAEGVFGELSRALLELEQPSLFFRALLRMDHLKDFFPELQACVGVPQNPVYHPEGDVFEHTMLALDAAAALRPGAEQPLGFMLSALAHDLGKAVATTTRPDGKIVSYGHELDGIPLCEALLRRLGCPAELIKYARNMTWLHMRPNVLANCRSKKKKTRQMFDLSLCPEDLILLSRADATGKRDEPYDDGNEAFLRERLEDYRRVMRQPMATEADLRAAGLAPGEELARGLDRARQLHLSGMGREAAVRQVAAEARGRRAVGDGSEK